MSTPPQPCQEAIENIGSALFKQLQLLINLHNKIKKTMLFYQQHLQDHTLPPNLRHKLEPNTWAKGFNPILTTKTDEDEQTLWKENLHNILQLRTQTLSNATTTLQQELQMYLEDAYLLSLFTKNLPQLALYPEITLDIVQRFKTLAREAIDRPIAMQRSLHSSRYVLDSDEEMTVEEPTQPTATTRVTPSSSSSSSSSSSATATTPAAPPTTNSKSPRKQTLSLESLQKTINDLATTVQSLIKNDTGNLKVNQKNPSPKTRAASPHRDSTKKNTPTPTLPSITTPHGFMRTDIPQFFNPTPQLHNGFTQPTPSFPAFQQQQQTVPYVLPPFLQQQQPPMFNPYQNPFQPNPFTPYNLGPPHYPAFKPPPPLYPAPTNVLPGIGKLKGNKKHGKSNHSVRFSK